MLQEQIMKANSHSTDVSTDLDAKARADVISQGQQRTDVLSDMSFYIGRVYYTYVGFLDRLLAESGIDEHVRPGMGHILFALFESDDLIIKDLVDRLELSPSTLTGMLKRMERAKLIRRWRDKNDGRAVRIKLTVLGRSLEGKCRQVERRLNDTLETGINREDSQVVKRCLSQMIYNMRHDMGDAGSAQRRQGR
ncbi:MAG: MarR family winged helix-turn-helix transcriptional regulator [Acidobacteriota bacterium]